MDAGSLLPLEGSLQLTTLDALSLSLMENLLLCPAMLLHEILLPPCSTPLLLFQSHALPDSSAPH